jgi:hypothetical protein
MPQCTLLKGTEGKYFYPETLNTPGPGLNTTMKATILAILLALGGGVLAAPTTKQAQFFSGVYLLQSLSGLPGEERAQKFHELEQLTGIDGGKAESVLSWYVARPAEWRKLCDSMIQMIDAAQGKTSAPAMRGNNPPSSGARR